MDYPVLNKAPNTADAFVTHHLDANGNAVPDSATNPALVALTGNTATDGSGTITAGGTAQNIYGATVPTNGWAVSNPDSSSESLWVSDTATAAANAVDCIEIPPSMVYETPPGRKPLGAVSIVAATTGHKFTASRW